MKHSMYIVMALLISGLVLTMGCTQVPPVPGTQTTGIPSGAPTTASPAVAAIPTAGFGTPGPTQVLPPDYMLNFQVTTNGDTANPVTAVILNGGNGMNLDSRVDANLTDPNGVVQTGSMLPPFFMGQQIAFPCSQYQNRVEIWVTAPQVGKVKVYDQIVPFQSLNR